MSDNKAASARRERTRETFLLYLFVALGTAIGGFARACVSIIAVGIAGSGFPWGTLAANVGGSFLIGLFAALTAPDGRLFLSTRIRQFVMVGICGGFTTFSIFSLETFRIAAEEDYKLAALNVVLSVTAWLAAVWAGDALARRFNRLGGF